MVNEGLIIAKYLIQPHDVFIIWIHMNNENLGAWLGPETIGIPVHHIKQSGSLPSFGLQTHEHALPTGQ